MNNALLLLSGNDIPFPEARLTIHQPTLKEISYIGEEAFFIGCGFLDFSKNLLGDKDKVRLEHYNDFDIFMSIILHVTEETKKSVECAFLMLSLIFPLYDISVRDDVIILKKDNEEFQINRNNFSAFKKNISEMFDLHLMERETEKYNPAGTMAQRIAEKFKKRQRELDKIARNGEEEKSIAILSRYASILAVGNHKNLNDLMQYTVFQLYDEFQRYQAKMQWDAYVQARMAGAKDLDEVDNWMIDLRSQDNKTKTKIKK